MAAEGKEGGPLQRSEERFRRVVESAPNAIVMIGHTGLIEMVNAEAERVFGYTRNELLGKPVEMLVPERSRSKHSNLRTSFFADSVSRPMGAGRDLYGLRKDGSEFPVEIGLNPIETEEGTRTLATPEPIKDWSLTGLKENLIKIGAKVVCHGRYVAFQMAEVAIPRQLFQEILRLLAELRPQPPPAQA
jgi:PAS domain S-box-containing protein